MATLATECEVEGAAAASTAAPRVSEPLLHWLDEGVDSHGERYLEMRRRLVAYFDRRNRLAAEALADETFRRIAYALQIGGVSPAAPPAHYCFATAKHVLLEDTVRERPAPFARDAPSVPVSQLERALDELPAEARQLMIDYYRTDRPGVGDHRRRIAARLHVAPAILAARASRIRDDVMESVIRSR